MKTYVFMPGSGPPASLSQDDCRDTVRRISDNTDTRDLVVTLYILRGPRQIRGTAYARAWMTPREFTTGRGHWRITRRWPSPEDLPQEYKLIRLRMDGQEDYPRMETDRYGWRFAYERFIDHLAALFAHELHHFRRYHLGLHPREGENAANRWALEHARSLGYRVEGRKLPARRRNPSLQTRMIRKHPHLDPYRRFRALDQGDRLVIVRDPLDRYRGQTVTVLRPIRSDSKRIVVRTPDGKSWRWPMEWLEIPAG